MFSMEPTKAITNNKVRRKKLNSKQLNDSLSINDCLLAPSSGDFIRIIIKNITIGICFQIKLSVLKQKCCSEISVEISNIFGFCLSFGRSVTQETDEVQRVIDMLAAKR
ncbi:unnamed protein product [Ceratitis capitata]|uniref:(Mediterranean fruit fly) hypothetical protein n=1 Tax=Ceratitis capitata TaxID=7213 RepID=A0A811UZ32_CERCA|nr:unnamed protein product [Ceratitis capitata]